MKIAALSSKAYGAPNNNYTYQGDYNEFDDDLGWHDFALRSYDPQTGRFLQSDPYEQFASGYIGMGNDPVNNIDPSGGFAGMGMLNSSLVGAVGGYLMGGIAAAVTGNGDEFHKWGAMGAFAGLLAGLGSNMNFSGAGSILKGVAPSLLSNAVNITSSIVGQNRGGGGPHRSYTQGGHINVTQGGRNVGVIDIPIFGGVPNYYKTNGLVIQLLFKNTACKLNRFNWVQTGRTNSFITSQAPTSPFNDASPENTPLYNGADELASSYVGEGNAAKFYDYPHRGTDETNIFWEGELSLVGADLSGVYHALVTVRYGFKVDAAGKLSVQDITVHPASGFQLSSIKNAKVGLLGRTWDWLKSFFLGQ